MRLRMQWGWLSLCLFAAMVFCEATPAHAIIVYGGSSGRNLTAPNGDLSNSGWQYEGSWQVGAGTPIASNFFLTAQHLGGSVGDTFVFSGQNYITTAFFDDPAGTDLRVWQVAQTFSTFAPLYTKSGELTNASPMTVFGRGTDRGADVIGPNGAQGYSWGAADGQMSWGTNQVSFVTTFDTGPAGDFLGFDFSPIPPAGVAQSSTVSAGDSGGGLFLKDTDGIWKLAGVNYAVDGNFSLNPDSDYFAAAMYDARDFYVGAPGEGNHILVGHPSPDGPVYQSAYASRVSTRLDFINTFVSVPEPGAGVLLMVGMTILVGRGVRKSRLG